MLRIDGLFFGSYEFDIYNVWTIYDTRYHRPLVYRLSMESCSDDEERMSVTYDSNKVHATSDKIGIKTGGDTMTDECRTTEFCWLCQYQGNRTTNEVLRFIMDGIPHMSLDSLVVQSKFILDNVEAESHSTTTEIKRHITEHMLHPRVKLALQLHELSKMQKDVSKCCIINDVESGERTVNPQAMRVYLTLCSQVSALYKIGEDKLIFNNNSMDK